MNTSQFFRDQALECREAALSSEDRSDRHGLEQLARHYEREAVRLGRPAAGHSESEHARI
ncbi:MAG: hypothetical protein JWO25_2486 [Alphaproteobacteria bacterium]|nr:hypothetical protein [Alphaproteobacteria bacterium]MDB5721727.1 hypothetical protein [Alphaproteobacteria bacterium]